MNHTAELQAPNALLWTEHLHTYNTKPSMLLWLELCPFTIVTHCRLPLNKKDSYTLGFLRNLLKLDIELTHWQCALCTVHCALIWTVRRLPIPFPGSWSSWETTTGRCRTRFVRRVGTDRVIWIRQRHCHLSDIEIGRQIDRFSRYTHQTRETN